MKLTFLGAAGTVTGSRTLVESRGHKILVDCGLFQGYKELRLRNWDPFPVPPAEIHAVVLTHAHLDHSGYIPLLVKNGFRGKIYCTQPTLDLCKLLLPDSGHIQEEDARRANRQHYTKHPEALPLYTAAEAEAALPFFHTVSFGAEVTLGDSLHFHFEHAGHILGAASVLLNAQEKTVLFSGDLGRPHDLVMNAPAPPPDADYLVVESTYGDRLHETTNPIDQLEAIISRTIKRGGSVIIPVFAVGRAQSLMYYIHELKKQNRIRRDLPVYLDSPMAIDATDILEHYLSEHRLSRDICTKMTQEVVYTRTQEESKRIDQSKFPKIILAASGMVTGGRILHHIAHLGGDHKNTIVFAGFQAGGTRGDRLLRGERGIKIHGEIVSVRAEITHIDGASAHADYREILGWIGQMRPAPKRVFITHGEPSASNALRHTLQEEHPEWSCVIPTHLQAIDL